MRLTNVGPTLAKPRPWRAPSVPAAVKAGQEWSPKAGQPGDVFDVGGRSYQVWALAPRADVWAVPVDARLGDEPFYRFGEDQVTAARVDVDQFALAA